MYQRGTACYKVRREYTATVKNPNPYMRRVWPIDKELPPFVDHRNYVDDQL